MVGLRIRDARSDDRGAIEAVTLAAYEQYAAVMLAHWEGYRQNILATLAAAQPEAQIMAEDDGRIVGTVLFYPAGSVNDIEDPAPRIVGCFDPRKLYPVNRLVLTSPVKC